VEQALGAQIVGIGVAGALARQHADAAAGAGALAGGFDNLLVNTESCCHDRLKIQVGVVAAGRERLAQAALEQALGNSEFLKKVAFVAGNRGNGRFGHRSQFTP